MTLRGSSTHFARLLRSLALAVLLTCLTAAGGSASAWAGKSVGAETMSVAPDGIGQVVESPSAKGGRALLIDSPGKATRRLNTNSGYGRIAVRAQGRPCGGQPELIVKLDGERVIYSTWPGGKWVIRSDNLTIPAGKHSLVLSYADDHSEAGCDRQITVDQIDFTRARIVDNPQARRDLEIESAGVAAATYYPELSGDPLATGAVKYNAEYERGERPKFNISLQSLGDDYIVAGLLRGDRDIIENGFLIYDWGFDKQVGVGNFGDNPDNTGPSMHEPHSTTFFIEAVAHSVLLLEQSPYAIEYADKINEYKQRLLRAAKWVTSESIWPKSVKRDAPYGHTYFLVSSGLAMTAKATDNGTLNAFAHERLRAGLALQHEDGWIPEEGGWDSGYQVIGLQKGELWVVYLPNDPLTDRLEEVLDLGAAWEATRIDPDGRVITDGNTRTCVRDDFGGNLKTPYYRTVVRAIENWGSITARPDLLELARRVEDYRLSGGPVCPPPPAP